MPGEVEKLKGPVVVIPRAEFRRWAGDATDGRREQKEFVLFALMDSNPTQVADADDAVPRPHPVPGFVTDFASIPPPIRWFVSPIGRYALAALYHDWGYYEHPYGEKSAGRRTVDDLFLSHMLQDGVARWKAAVMHRFVRAFGWAAFRNSHKANPANDYKIVPEEVMRRLASDFQSTPL
jgi:hypothetical protein